MNLLKSSVLGGRVLLAYRDPRGRNLVVSLEAPVGEFTVTALALDAAQVLRDDPESDLSLIHICACPLHLIESFCGLLPVM